MCDAVNSATSGGWQTLNDVFESPIPVSAISRSFSDVNETLHSGAESAGFKSVREAM